MTGTLMTSHTTAAAIAVRAHARIFPARRHRISSGPSSSTGYSLAAVPSPNSAPGQHRFLAGPGSMAPAVMPMASRSQLVKACTISSGDRHMIAVSQIRRRAIFAVTATAHRYIRPRKIAPMVKYAADVQRDRHAARWPWRTPM